MFTKKTLSSSFKMKQDIPKNIREFVDSEFMKTCHEHVPRVEISSTTK